MSTAVILVVSGWGSEWLLPQGVSAGSWSWAQFTPLTSSVRTLYWGCKVLQLATQFRVATTWRISGMLSVTRDSIPAQLEHIMLCV